MGQSDARAFEHTGAFFFEPQVLQFIPTRTYFDSYSQLIPALLSAGIQVYGYDMSGYWNGLELFQKYQEAQKVFLYSAYEPAKPESESSQRPRVRFPSIEGQQIAPGIWVGHNHIIHPSARLAAPLCIGEGCRIGYGVELGPEVVIGSSVVIDDDATIFQSTVLDRTYVGQLVNINNRVIYKTTLIDVQTSESTQVIDPFLLAETRVATRRGGFRRSDDRARGIGTATVTLPLTFLIGLAVALTSGGRVFARSPRVGQLAGMEGGQPDCANIRSSSVPNPWIKRYSE